MTSLGRSEASHLPRPGVSVIFTPRSFQILLDPSGLPSIRFWTVPLRRGWPRGQRDDDALPRIRNPRMAVAIGF